MTELKFYRFIMTCLLIVAGIAAIKSYGDHRVNEFLSRGGPAVPVTPGDAHSPAGQSAFPTYNSPAAHSQMPLRQPPAADPWRVVQGSSGEPVALKSNTALPLNNQSPKGQPVPVAPALPSSTELLVEPASPAVVEENDPAEDAMVVEVRQLRKRLGRVGVAEILSEGVAGSDDFDAEAVFAETLRSLQSQAAESPDELNLREDEKAVSPSNSELEPEEIAQARIQLELFAEMLKPVQPQRAEECLRLAERFGQLIDPEPSQKR